ncbi:MAG TPA: TIGR02996 domain-containing protein [Gemmataceae bacterium]
MSERNAFLKILDENEDDTTTRLVYADWLDEHGEHEEADRQRKWPAAKAWLVQFCRDHNPPPDDEDSEEWVISYAELIELGREAVEEADEEGLGFSCGNNMTMCDALRDNSREFWKNWAIVTGIAVPPDIEDKSYFRCAC